MKDLNEIEILLVEDNVYDAELCVRVLRKFISNEKILTLSDGEEALNFIFCKEEYSERNKTKLPRIILLDLKMPKIGGLEVLKILKSDKITKQIPIIILTSSNQEKDIINSYNLGVNSYIVKPVKYESFINSIKEIGLYWLTINQNGN